MGILRQNDWWGFMVNTELYAQDSPFGYWIHLEVLLVGTLGRLPIGA